MGEQYLERCVDIVDAVDVLRSDAQATSGQPHGMLNVAAAAYPARKKFAPLFPPFLAAYPDVHLNLHLHDQPISLIDEGIDVAIRIGDLEDSSLIAPKCGDISLRLTASPSGLEKFGKPDSIDALASYPCLVDTTPTHGSRWPVGQRIKVDGPVTANDGEIIRQMTLAGLGISLLPDFFVDEDIQSGALISLFSDQIDHRVGVYLLFHSHRQLSPAARLFIDFMVEHIGG